MKGDLISIIIPAYNAQNYIEETINSVLNQTYLNWELIVIDDGSIDSTALIINKFVELDNRIHYIFQENGRQGKARNTGLKYAKGEYIAFIDADDLWHPEKLSKQINCIKSQNVDIVFTQGWSFETNVDSKKNIDTPIGLQDNRTFFLKQLYGYGLPMLSAMVSKIALSKIGGFEEDHRVQNAEDYHLWLKFSDEGYSFYGMKDRLFYYRLHSEQSTSEDKMAMKQVIWAISLVKFNSISKQQKKAILNQRLNRFLIHGIDHLSDIMLIELIMLYSKPLKLYLRFLIVWIFFHLNKSILKKIGYKFFDLKQDITI